MQQPFDFYLVLDFEASCNDSGAFQHEVIEFPTVALNAHTLKIESEFHAYIKPVLNPLLTPFCTSLTGITQVGTVA